MVKISYINDKYVTLLVINYSGSFTENLRGGDTIRDFKDQSFGHFRTKILLYSQ